MMGKDLWLDPTAEEAAVSRGSLTLACMPALGTITSIWQTGQMSTDEAIQVCKVLPALSRHMLIYLECMEECQARCTDIHVVVAKALLDSQTQSE
jgi:exosome complex component MTR3